MRSKSILLLSLLVLLPIPVATAQRGQIDGEHIGRPSDLPLAAPEDIGMSSEKLALVRPALEQMVRQRKLPGAIVIVGRRGKVVLVEAVGWADVEAKRPLKQDAILRFYSMSKPITSLGVMILVEEGKIALDDPASRYIPEFKGLKVFDDTGGDESDLIEAEREMTIRDLLRHTSGLTYGYFGATPVDRKYMAARVLSPSGTLEDMARKLGELPLLYQPGARFNYSVSTDVLGHVIERASGRPLDVFFQQRIFQPLGIDDTAFYVPDDKRARLSNNYSPAENESGLRVIDAADNSAFANQPTLLSGGGGLVSTAGDYMRFCQMLLGGGQLNGTRIVSAEVIEQMTTNQLPDAAYPLTLSGERDGVGFGFGFSVVVEKTQYTERSHLGEYGWGGAASTHFWISPRDELAVVALTQQMPFTFQLEDAVKPLIYDAIIPAAATDR